MIEEAYPYWLSKQMMKGVRRFNIDSFLVALEGWRRGLSLTFHNNHAAVTDLKVIGFEPVGKTFSLSLNDRTHFFYRTRGDKVENEAVEVGTNKKETKRILASQQVPVPEGFEFSTATSWEEVARLAEETGYPLTLKPTFGSLGKGVITNIKTQQELRESMDYVISQHDYTDYLLERHISGDDVRVYVIEGEVAAATKRVPANVMGDGVHTIEELVERKNTIRSENPQTSTRLIKIDEEMKNFLLKKEKRLEDVPSDGELVNLKGQSNISAGGDSIDVTDRLRADVAQTAIDAVKAVPGLNHAGIDLIVNDQEAVVIEINPTAGISLHTFPLFGTKQNIAAKIIDYYFPETKGITVSDKIYFDYKNILDLFRSNSLEQARVTDAPVGQLYAKRYVISGNVQKVGYRRWIRRQAIEQGLHGYTRNLNNGNVVVVVAGIDKHTVDDFKDTCYHGSSKAEVEKIKEFAWDKQIRIGFEIRKSR
ncbi:acylphosphatase [Thalassobacillus sp. B23F22_16]|uniref:acylphosphatase n=1 Tax=Thalassobacillus sp. B23F22_16 TaxID=3459513 RepID=UPI00373EB1B5